MRSAIKADEAVGASHVRRANDQLIALRPTFISIAGLVFSLGVVILIVYATTHINVHHLVADPSEIAFLPEYTGVYSYLGVLVLWTAAVLSVVAGYLVRGVQEFKGFSLFFRTFGVLLGWLAADDLFMWHEWAGLVMAQAIGAEDVGTARSGLEVVVFAIMGAVWLAWLIRFRKRIMQTEYLLLAVALAALGLSVLVDLAPYVVPSLEPQSFRMQTTIAILEELLKLAGIFLLFAYVLRMAITVIRRISVTKAIV
jgi:hypothetical protein